MERDANGDGKLSKDELPERMQRAFERLDKNSDGSIDADELKQMRRRGRPDGGAGDKKPETSGPVEAD